jgi:hypothetical protein
MRIHRKVRFVASAVLCFVTATLADAQPKNVLIPGSRVRVETPTSELVSGSIAMLRGDSVWLRLDDSRSTTAYRVSSLRSISQSLGVDRWRGARRGTYISGAIGLVTTALVLRDDLKSSDRTIPSTLFVAPAAILFTALGAGFGAVAVEERWSPPRGLYLGPSVDAPTRFGVLYQLRF